MGYYLIKPHPDRDEFVVWFSVPDGPVAAGTRAEIERWGQQHGEPMTGQHFATADATGSSYGAGNSGDWSCTRFLLHDIDGLPAAEQPRWVTREQLPAFIAAEEAGDAAAMRAVSEPAPDGYAGS